VDLGVQYGVIRRSGAWYTYDGGNLGQGKEKAKLALAGMPKAMDEIDVSLRALLAAETASGTKAPAAPGPVLLEGEPDFS